ncbi:hypothetical protein HPB49_005706 [Dermacentor silvarum]|uniref:Uncharacterized protein n=1 Tax=Dermacentor silvarum TaxID=543639 RepID=A0ACB8C7M0_DERSI|nr:hypothetical protein HPB49_005706 [Dermacentor silvarum]
MAGDFNAKHHLWGPADGDTRGAQLAQFTAANNLIVLNDPRSPPTFQSHLAESWIDVSFASVPLASCGYSWAVADVETLSDHKFIQFSFFGQLKPKTKRLTKSGTSALLQTLVNLRWFTMVQGSTLRSPEAVDLVVAKFYAIFDRLCRAHSRWVRPRQQSTNSWWTPELTVERKRVRALCRRYQRTADPSLRQTFKDSYYAAHGNYKMNIDRAKTSASKSLCSELSKREVSAAPTLGSPQGSPISPLLWNIIIYGLLELPFPADVFAQAYADDTVVVISAPNRIELEAKSSIALGLISAWAHRAKVVISAEKSHFLYFSNSHSSSSGRIRQPIVRLADHFANSAASRGLSRFVLASPTTIKSQMRTSSYAQWNVAWTRDNTDTELFRQKVTPGLAFQDFRQWSHWVLLGATGPDRQYC